MILRIFKAIIHEGRIDEFKAMVQEQSIPWLKGSDGMMQYMPGEPLDESKREFTMVTLWRDLESLKAFCGEDWDRAVVTSDEQPLVEEMSVEHYQYFES